MNESRSRKVKIGLAGLVVLGVGVAATSALWSDNVWFQGDVSTSSFNLQGSVTSAEAGFEEASSEVLALTIPVVEDLAPGETVTRTVWVKNTDSTHAADLVDTPDVKVTGDAASYLTVSAAYDTSGAKDPNNLATGDVIPVDVTYAFTNPDTSTTGPNAGAQGKTAKITVQVTGTEIAS
jgi:predicted ribosomally synthesized peptide with SipW-like signal peptide